MAEGFARALLPEDVSASSAGIVAKGLNPLAVAAMSEAGVDIRGQTSKTLAALDHESFDVVVTVCGHANETCPTYLRRNVRVLHVGFDDPPELARGAATVEEAMPHYRRVRDEIRAFILRLPELLSRPAAAANPCARDDAIR